MKTTKKTISLIIIFAAISNIAYGQAEKDLNKAEKEVWKTVQTYYKASAAGDWEEYVSNFHPEFYGWHPGFGVPDNYKHRTDALKGHFKNTKTLEYSIKLHAINIHNNVAIVQYTNDKTGEKSSGKMDWTDILVKENGKWLLVADHGTPGKKQQ